MTHALKTDAPYFLEVAKGNKKFEIRKDDRPFNTGDKLLLQEYTDGKYSGQELELRITHVLRNATKYGLREHFCIISFEELPVNNA